MFHHTILSVFLLFTSLSSTETLDLSRANSGSFELTAQLYEGDSVALSNIDCHLFANSVDVLLRPEVGAMTLFVVQSNSHTVSNMSLSLNNAKSFSHILSGSKLEYVGCVMADGVITGPLAVINGGSAIFRELTVCGSTIQSPIVCSESSSNGTFSTHSSKYADLQVVAPNQLFNITGIIHVEITSCTFKEIEYLTDDEEISDEPSAPITTGLASAILQLNTFESVESPLTHVVLPLFTAQNVGLHSSTMKSCYSNVKVPAYTTPDSQKVDITSTKFVKCLAYRQVNPHFINLNSKGLLFTLRSSSFKNCDSYGSVLSIPFATKIDIRDVNFEKLTVIQTNDSVLNVGTVPVSFGIYNSTFHTCTSVGPAGALSFGGTRNWNESKPVDPEVPIEPETTVNIDSHVDPETPEDPEISDAPEGRNRDDDPIEPHFEMRDVHFHYNQGSEVTDILVAIDVASSFTVATFSNCKSSSKSSNAIISGQSSFRLTQIKTPSKGWVAIGVPLIAIVGVGIIVGVVFSCAGLCCCACPCCCPHSNNKGFCCRNNHKCCCAVDNLSQEGDRTVGVTEMQNPLTVSVSSPYSPSTAPGSLNESTRVTASAPSSSSAPNEDPTSSEGFDQEEGRVNKNMPLLEPELSNSQSQPYHPSQPPTEDIPNSLPPPRSIE
ncbi:hypothetical protein BLNAU_8455 [Blattamonas nauphoetae]|uniref:Uncharacterized protein n=1 Tax=Blattamonas nauphoetae TaxID=2049346 RepID=A0ABQ9XYP1_9EUKA|nr:hypothetical protein BLNAU_8455 [Blattamonas nauphoetae]